jgi:hypothetical protein
MPIFYTSAIDAFHSYIKIMFIFCTLAIAGFRSYMKISPVFWRFMRFTAIGEECPYSTRQQLMRFIAT